MEYGKDPTLSSNEMERLWSWLLNEANLYTNRLNFYIVAESMFFAAFASYSGHSFLFYIACSSAGIFLSIIWLILSIHQNNNVVLPLRKAIYNNWNIGKYIDANQKKKLRTHFIVGIILPIFMILMWIIILFSELLSH